ncbi:MAG: hypothetical protein AAGA30_17855 [Planctomycetota bacterium]
MVSSNPYTPPSFTDSLGTASFEGPRYYLLRHFLIFFASYLTCMFLFFWVFSGLHETIVSLAEQTGDWIIAASLGLVVWFVHASIAKLNASVYDFGPKLNAFVAAIGFMFCVLASQLVADYGPDFVAGPWSWTPEYVRIPIYVAGSTLAVVVVAKLRRQHAIA